jgi:hypothetical protein
LRLDREAGTHRDRKPGWVPKFTRAKCEERGRARVLGPRVA